MLQDESFLSFFSVLLPVYIVLQGILMSIARFFVQIKISGTGIACIMLGWMAHGCVSGSNYSISC